MKNIWANFRTFNCNIGYLRRDHTFMYFQIKSDLREKIWKFGHFYNKKTKSRFRNFYKKLLVMTTCCKQVKIINLCAPKNNLLHKIPIPSFFQARQKGRD